MLTLEYQAPGKVALGVPIFKSLVRPDPEKKNWRKRESNPGRVALEADTLTTRPTRRFALEDTLPKPVQVILAVYLSELTLLTPNSVRLTMTKARKMADHTSMERGDRNWKIHKCCCGRLTTTVVPLVRKGLVKSTTVDRSSDIWKGARAMSASCIRERGEGKRWTERR